MSEYPYEIRCPVHGFVQLNSWEWDIISEPVFQRLRRIRQLAWTDQVYPGATHTRFEHSLGMMHTASLLYDAIWRNGRNLLQQELGYNESGRGRFRQFVRLAALLHDVGHTPFSHAADDFLKWDDWRVLGLLAAGGGGEHGERLATRCHYKRIYQTPEVATKDDLTRLDEAKAKLGHLLADEARAEKSWYKTGDVDIPILFRSPQESTKPLSALSSVLRNMKGNNQVLLYVRPEDRVSAKAALAA